MQVSNQYWAGFFDGEGSVCLERYHSKIHDEKFIVGVKVCVTQKETFVLYLLAKNFGGKVLLNKQKVHKWYCGKAEQAIAFLTAVKPYVIVKATEVHIALELLDAIVKPRGTLFPLDEKGIKRLKGKAPIAVDEIKRRQLLEAAFFKDRYDDKFHQTLPEQETL